MYSGETLVEKTGINMTDVLGNYLIVQYLNINPGLDANTFSMFEFNFRNFLTTKF